MNKVSRSNRISFKTFEDLKPGDKFYYGNTDGRKYEFTVVEKKQVPDVSGAIWALSEDTPHVTFSRDELVELIFTREDRPGTRFRQFFPKNHESAVLFGGTSKYSTTPLD